MRRHGPIEDEIMDIDRKPTVDLGHLRQASDVVDVGNALDGQFFSPGPAGGFPS